MVGEGGVLRGSASRENATSARAGVRAQYRARTSSAARSSSASPARSYGTSEPPTVSDSARTSRRAAGSPVV